MSQRLESKTNVKCGICKYMNVCQQKSEQGFFDLFMCTRNYGSLIIKTFKHFRNLLKNLVRMTHGNKSILKCLKCILHVKQTNNKKKKQLLDTHSIKLNTPII